MAGHQNHAANAAEWAERAEKQREACEERRKARRAEKEATRTANRAAWWQSRYGKAAPTEAEPVQVAEPEPVELVVPELDAPEPEALHVKGCKVEQASATEWHAIATDGTGYLVEGAGYTVEIEGKAYSVPTLDAARELIELAEETRREQAAEVAKFRAGMTYEDGAIVYQIVQRYDDEGHKDGLSLVCHTAKGDYTMVKRIKPRPSGRGQYVLLHGKSEWMKSELYAADMAA